MRARKTEVHSRPRTRLLTRARIPREKGYRMFRPDRKVQMPGRVKEHRQPPRKARGLTPAQQAVPAQGPGGGARLFPGAGYGTASAHPSTSTVETAPAVRFAQRGSLFSSREADSFSHAPRMPI